MNLCLGNAAVFPSRKFEAVADFADGHDVDASVRETAGRAELEFRRLAFPQRSFLG